jgi:hypothetical protein
VIKLEGQDTSWLSIGLVFQHSTAAASTSFSKHFPSFAAKVSAGDVTEDNSQQQRGQPERQKQP